MILFQIAAAETGTACGLQAAFVWCEQADSLFFLYQNVEKRPLRTHLEGGCCRTTIGHLIPRLNV